MTTAFARSQFAVCIAAVVAFALPVADADEAVKLVPIDTWTTAFADTEIRISLRANSAVPNSTVQWSHSANQRTLRRGEATIQPDGVATVVLKTPSLRAGVIQRTQLTFRLTQTAGQKPSRELQRPLWLFPRDAFAGRTAWASSLALELFDPSGDTERSFDSLNLPYRKIRTLAGTAEAAGILIVGEGLSLNRNEMTHLMDAMNQGRRVIVLAPREGSVPLFEDDGISLAEMRLANNHVIRELDKRLDTTSWPSANNTVPAQRLFIESRRGRIQGTVSDGPQGWTWGDLKSQNSDGRLLFCGFRIIEHMEKGPTPRYLLRRILETLSPDRDAATTPGPGRPPGNRTR